MQLPPPDHAFASDNVAAAHPAVMDALVAANAGSAVPYGEDPWTARAIARLRTLLGAPDAEILFTYGGTGANVVALASVLAPHEAVICPSSAHINTDECGAPERFTGAKLIDVPTPDGKLTPEMVLPLLHGGHGEHQVQPAVIAISQTTELGTVYSLDEVRALADLAHTHGLHLFVDGARLANGVAALGCSLAEITAAGVDLLTFGGTKNGLMYGEAVVFLDPALAHRARYVRKQSMQLASKMRFVSAQFGALLADDLWLQGARHANEMARLLAASVRDIDGVRLLREPQANSLFVYLPKHTIEPLRQWSFFWAWDDPTGLVRWMTSFATTEEDVRRFAAGVREAVTGA